MAKPLKKIEPKKTELKKETPVLETVNLDDLIQKAVNDAIAKTAYKYELEISKLKEKIASKPVEKSDNSKIDRKYKYIPADCRIIIKSNISGLFTYHEDRGKNRLFIEIADFGQTYELTYEEFTTFFTSKPHYFKMGKLAIADVIVDDKLDITVEDIIVNKQLQSVYFDKNVINPMDIENIFTDSVEDSEFERLVNNSKHLAEPILEIGCALYKRGLFSNNAKMNVMKQVYSRPNLFK